MHLIYSMHISNLAIIKHSHFLLQKLYHYGIRGVAYDWFCDYLKNRTQLVSYHNIQSNYADISCGVPQGAILGPLLFFIYINDMAFVSTQLFSVSFADDTNMFGTDNDLEALILNVNTEHEKIVKWLNANKLSREYLLIKEAREIDRYLDKLPGDFQHDPIY